VQVGVRRGVHSNSAGGCKERMRLVRGCVEEFTAIVQVGVRRGCALLEDACSGFVVGVCSGFSVCCIHCTLPPVRII
jgi:hypothetical protein